MSLKHEKHRRSEIANKTYLTKGWGYVAALALLPYAILKSLWAWGSTVGFTTKQAVQDVAGFGDTLKEGPAFLYTLYTIGIDFTAILAILASLFALALVTSWGEKLPKWLLMTSRIDLSIRKKPVKSRGVNREEKYRRDRAKPLRSYICWPAC